MFSWLTRSTIALIWLSLAALVVDAVWLGLFDYTDEWSSIAAFPVGPVAVAGIVYTRRGVRSALTAGLLMIVLEVAMIVPAVFIVLVGSYTLAG